ncbi:hypothetical protein ESZ28_17645 [Colwellia hornerae]|uniref:Uncharacterized protein n=1 Tax=Colwellia hornerae TaxID=89402 RepID=A0A5C6Q3A4_9GAMM|nr:hypothetical protein ESZ28_17645 [Colwellia hornerae]TWX54520.1 hypothetical protein ESZ26_17615 [Colwellia hornerae]TWX63300.1 hypothetical protein ESZ27_17200 [Colwellia hornerae]
MSFCFYFAWSYWANGLVSEDQSLVLRTAIVQGTLSGTITILFTFILEKSVSKFGQSYLSLIFVVPIICTVFSKTKQNIAIFRTFRSALDRSAKYLSNNAIPGTLLAPLLPIAIQSTIAIGVNLINQTPNLWLTVAPSIVITAIYGYVYTFTLLNKPAEPA